MPRKELDAGVLLRRRIFYRLDPDAVVIAAVAKKKSQKTPKGILGLCKRRLAQYDQDQEE